MRRVSPGTRLLANPYVVLADLLIATFFVLVIYIHKVREEVFISIDRKAANVRSFERALKTALGEALGSALQDESNVSWQDLPSGTTMVIKQDTSSIKLFLLGMSEDKALFPPRKDGLTDWGVSEVTMLARTLAKNTEA